MKKLLSLLLVFALLLSCAFVLASCGDDEPVDDGSTPPASDTPEEELDLDEGFGKGNRGVNGVSVLTDATNPDSGKEAEENYIHG